MRNYIQEGRTLTATAPSGGVVSGKLTILGAMPMIPTIDAAEGVEFEGETEGVYRLPKASADTVTKFAKAYLLADETAITTVSTDNTLVGVFTEPAEAGDVLCAVRLSGVAV